MLKGNKKGILIAFFLLAAVLLVNAAYAEPEDENLLYNGDFELLDKDGLPDGWFTDAYRMDPGYSVYKATEGMEGEGSRAALLQNSAKNDARFAQTVEVEPESVYCLSGYIRADGIEEGLGANLSIENVYAFSEKVYDTDGNWQYIEYYGETGPDQYSVTVFARVGGYSGESRGTAAFDRLSLKKVDEVPEDVYPELWFRYDAPYEDEPFDEWGEFPEEQHETSPAWPWLAAIGMIYVLSALALIYCCRDGKRILSGPSSGTGVRYLPILLFALLLRIAVSFFVEGYGVDVGCFLSWGYTMAHNGPVRFYQQTSFCDYPPLYTYVLGLNSYLSNVTGAGTNWTRVIFRLFPSVCDVAACALLLYFPRNRFTQERFYRALVLLLAFNPVTVLNSAAWGQMDSVLCLLLLCVAVFACEEKWVLSIAFYVTAILVKPQALMLGFLGLAFLILAAVKQKKSRNKIMAGAGIGVALIVLYILPFSIQQKPGWLVELYRNTLNSYPYATVNTANLYYIAGGNWSKIESTAHTAVPLILSGLCALHGIILFLRNRGEKYAYAEPGLGAAFSVWFAVCAVIQTNWIFVGAGAMVYAFVIVISMAIRSSDLHLLPYLGAMLFILLYVFGIKMHERYLFPAFLLLTYAWALKKDRRILYVLLLFSLTVFVNEGIVLDNSIRLGDVKGHLNEDTVWLADILSILNVTGALYAVYIGYALMNKRHPGPVKALPAFLPVRTVSSGKTTDSYRPDRRLHWNLRDTVILSCITILYSVVALTTLGSTKAPQTAWTSSGEEEQIVFELQGEPKDIRILYFAQVSREDFTVAQSNDGKTWSEETYAQMDQGQCWKWKYVTLSYPDNNGGRTYYNSTEYITHFRGKYIRLTSGQVGLVLNEVIFRDADGKTIPARIYSRTGGNPDSVLWSDPEKLLDEPETMEKLPGFFGMEQAGETQPSWWNSTYFDEIYHARTGFEFVNGTVPYETSHPPLGKVFISWCILIFGMTPFGWRFAGAVAGILMLPGIYLLGKQLTKKTLPAAFACGLMALDCMHLTQTQIATIDSFPVLFIIFAYFFMLRFLQTDLSACTMKEALIPLAFSGLNMGLSIASKWIGIYAGAGLAVLYFWHLFRQVRVAGGRERNPGVFIRSCAVSLWCVLFFIIVPIAVYLLSYIPYMAYNTRIHNIKDYADAVWRAQESMFSYHSTPGLGMDHPFYSPWWQWPIIGKPMFYATEQYIPKDAALHHSIFSFGNPAVWWGALAALAVLLYRWIREKHYLIEGLDVRWHWDAFSWDSASSFLLIGLLAQYLPWVLVPRGTYIYHYFASIPFLILISSLSLHSGTDNTKRIRMIIGGIWLAVSAVLFVLLLPYMSGMAAPAEWLDIGKHILRIWY